MSMKKEEIKEELVWIFGDIFSEGRYSEEEHISCVLKASRFRSYVENVVNENTPYADTIYRYIKNTNIILLREKHE